MKQTFVSVTDARPKLKQLMDLVMTGKSRVVLVRDSQPQVAMVRYSDMTESEEETEKEWQKRWDRLLREGKKAGKRWAKEQGIDLKTISEEELYDRIAQFTRGH